MNNDSILKQSGGRDKILHYNWKVIDEPGKLIWILKTALNVDPSYQRAHSNKQATDLASEWSWVACGTITVGVREDGTYVVIDGQHRVMASKKRSDITELPCISFRVSSVSQEAINFVRTNTNRRNVQSLDKYKALIIARDETALYLQTVFEKYGIKISSSVKSPKTIKSVALCYKLAETDKNRLENVIEFLSILCKESPINEKLIHGLYYISKNLTIDLTDHKLRQRILKYTPSDLTRGATQSAAYFAEGGARVWAMGILNVVNSGLHNKYRFKDEVIT